MPNICFNPHKPPKEDCAVTGEIAGNKSSPLHHSRVLLAFLFPLILLPPAANAQVEPSGSLKSDMNNDNRVDSEDLLILMRERRDSKSVSPSDKQPAPQSVRTSPLQPLNLSVNQPPEIQPDSSRPFHERKIPEDNSFRRRNNTTDIRGRFLAKYSEVREKKKSKGLNFPENVRIGQTKDGYIDWILCPRGEGIAVSEAKSNDPVAAARGFLSQWGALFFNASPAVEFELVKVKPRPWGSVVRLQQSYSGIRFLGAQVTIQVDSSGRITSMLGGLVTETHDLDSGQIQISPDVPLSRAKDIALDRGSDDSNSLSTEHVTPATPNLLLYATSSSGRAGRIRLVWNLVISGPEIGFQDEGILIDAHDGEIALRYPLTYKAMYRDIYDKNGSSDESSGSLERSDSTDPPGSSASGISEVDKAWDYFYSVYSFYYNQTGRNGIFGTGDTIVASVRSCYRFCNNALWSISQQQMYFGDGWAIDDVCGHEYTHGVIYDEVGVIYFLEAGAFGESMSDSWGEWIDQTYTHSGDDDSSGSKWLMFEDLDGGALRDMADPPAFGDPDRYKGEYWTTDPGEFTHANNGVGNKLCYLLTDGDTHNGFSIPGMGIADTADLFYEVILLMVNAEDAYHKMYKAFIDGAATLGFSASETTNLEKACQAVNIRKDTGKGIFLKDGAGATVGVLEDSGKPDLKRTLSQSQSSITPGASGIVVKDSAGTVVAYVDGTYGSSGGEMKITGTLTEDTNPADSADNLIVIRFETVNVTTIDKYGNFKIWGELSEDVTF